MSAAPEIDLDISQLALDVVNRKLRGVNTRIENSITDGSLTRTIDGASTLTLTVHDPRRVLLRSGVFDFAIDVQLDRFFWRLVQVNKQADELTLTFEDREVAYLREHYSAKKATRGKVTRAEFALSLVREVREERIPFICPELDVTQQVAIESKKHARTARVRAEKKQKGLSLTADVTIKGQVATLAQKKLAERVLDVADSLSAGTRATLALLEACITESVMHNLPGGDRDSRGILQIRDSTARPMGIDNMDPSACANAFLTRGFFTDPDLGGGGAIAIASRNPNASIGQIAQATQGSGRPNAYDPWLGEAQGLLAAYGGTSTDDGSLDATQTRTLPYQFRRGTADGERENSWTCLQRLADEVNWRCFVSAGSVYFISEAELVQAKPRFLLDEQTPGVLNIDFDIDSGKSSHEATLTVRASRWAVAPGAVVELQNCGPGNGRWLVATIDRNLFEATATVTLRRASTPLPEPPADTTSATANGGRTPNGGAQVTRAWNAASAIGAKRYPYVWGGGHAHAGTPDGGTAGGEGGGVGLTGYDCSGSTAAVLAAAGMGFTLGGAVPVSGAIASSWGDSGEGSGLTVWANAIHVFMVFHTSSGDVHFGTGDWGKGWDGAGFNPNLHPTSGFTPRHWPGT